MDKQLNVELMGASISVRIKHKEVDRILNSVKEMIYDFNNRFSANKEDSLLMEVNKNAGKKSIVVDEDIFELVKISKEYSIKYDKTLNIAIGPLIKLWKVGFKDATKPSQEEIEKLLTKISPEKIILNEATSSIFLEEEGMEIDLGAVAKGYFADKIKEYLIKQGVEQGIIDFGGNVLTIGESYTQDHKFWIVGLQNPKEKRGELLGYIPIKDKSVVTSGIYERFFELEGKRYHHIFNSNTGYPIENNIASVTVVAAKSLMCEIWTSIFFMWEIDEALARVNEKNDMGLIIVDRENNIYLSDNLKKVFVHK